MNEQQSTHDRPWAKKNVEHLRADLSALRLMRGQTHPPRYSDATILESGAKLGIFWSNCKWKRKCSEDPHNRLLTNPVLKADYRTTSRHERYMTTQRSPDDSVQKNAHERVELSAPRWTRSQQPAGLAGGETLRSPPQRVRQPQFEL